MNEIVTNIAVEVISTAVEVAGGTIADKSAGKSVNQHDRIIDDLKRQLDDARKVNRALSAYLKEVHGLNDEQIMFAQNYRPATPKKPTLSHCPHCNQRLFSRNVSVCNHCQGPIASSKNLG